MSKTIDALLKKLPKNYNLTVQKDKNGMKVSILAPDDEGGQIFDVTVRVDGNLKEAAKGLEVAAEIVNEASF